MTIRSVGVIGAGQMGNGIAHVFALAGYDVTLNDIAPERIETALGTIEKNLDRQLKREKITEAEKAAALSRIHPTTSLDGFGEIDLVIEAATENEDLKKRSSRQSAKGSARIRS